MQQKPGQIITNFAPDTAFEIATGTEAGSHRSRIAKLLVLPLEEQPNHIKLDPSDRGGIPFSAIND